MDREFESVRPLSEVKRERRVFAHFLIGRAPEELAVAFDLPVADVLAIAERSATDGDLRSVQENIVASLGRQGLPAPARALRTPPLPRPRPSLLEDGARIAVADVVAAVAAAARDSPSGLALSQEDYSRWRAERYPSAPSIRTIRRRVGWGRAKRLALEVGAAQTGTALGV